MGVQWPNVIIRRATQGSGFVAKKVQVELLDDLDGTEATETVVFGLDGAMYEIDLCDANAQRLRDGLAEFIGSAQRTGGRQARGTRTPSQINADAAHKERLAEIRDWARKQGYDVSERGRLRLGIVEEFDRYERQKAATPIASAPASSRRRRTA